MAGMRSTNGVTSRDIGAFVYVDGGPGFGRLVSVDATRASVQFFRSPGPSPYVTHQHVASDITVAVLPDHTRVYLHDGRRWRIGRIDGVHPSDPSNYLVAFPNGGGAILRSDAFEVRWALPIEDPFAVLEAAGGDSPVVYEPRLAFLDAWSRQRAASAGVEGLLLGSVELHPHQLAVVRRVASDAVQRYLLADEVGLGKTIEASALLWQYLHRRPDARVLVLAPDHLRQQWATELLDRFRSSAFSQAQLRIRSFTDPASWPNEPVDFMIVDEAHHATRNGTLGLSDRGQLTRLAHEADALLLLSATPVRSNEAGFLDLLYLLDPQHYRPDQIDDFTRRVELRDKLALTYQALEPDLDEFDIALYATELTRMFGDDTALAELLAVAVDADDTTRPSAIRRVREHLSEGYRLHHRLLRTRRSKDIAASFAVRGRQRARPFTLEVDDPADHLRTQLLDSVRLQLAIALEQKTIPEEATLEVVRDVAARCGSLPHALANLFSQDPPHRGDWASFLTVVEQQTVDTWRGLFHAIMDTAESTIENVGRSLAQVTLGRGVARTVIASSYTESAVVVGAEIARLWGENRVAYHLATNSPQQNTEEVSRWADNGPCAVLVCDASAEEGINLQEADLLIHLDLPWDAFRIEQRVGRCDRHSTSQNRPIPSMVVTFGDQPHASAWFEFVADGCQVFSRPISSLQYVLADIERATHAEVISKGPEALLDSVSDLTSALSKELERIIAHDALDSLVSADHEGPSVDEELINSDRDPTLTTALTSWLTGVGANIRQPAPGVFRVARRPRPQVDFALEVAMAPFVEESLASSRAAAVRHKLAPLRAGHPLPDTVAEHLQSTDRGIAFALFRPVADQWPPTVVLRADFLVSVNSDDLIARAQRSGAGDWLRQVVVASTPPLVETVTMSIDGREVTHPTLTAPYDQRRGDLNLTSRPDLFEALTESLDWHEACANGANRALALLRQRPAVQARQHQGARAIRGHVQRRVDRDRSRALAGLDSDQIELGDVLLAVPEQLELHFKLLGAGALFLGDPKRLG